MTSEISPEMQIEKARKALWIEFRKIKRGMEISREGFIEADSIMREIERADKRDKELKR